MAKKPTVKQAEGANGKAGNVETANPVAAASPAADAPAAVDAEVKPDEVDAHDEVDTDDEAIVEPVADEPAQPTTIPGTILPLREPTLAELNASAYRAHQEDQDFRKRKAQAAVAAMDRVLRKVQ